MFVAELADWFVMQEFMFENVVAIRGIDCLLTMIELYSRQVNFQLELRFEPSFGLEYLLFELTGLNKRFVLVGFVDLLEILDSRMLLLFEIELVD